MVGRLGLVKPGTPSKVAPNCLVFGDNNKYYGSCAKNNLPTFWAVLKGGSYVTPLGNLWV